VRFTVSRYTSELNTLLAILLRYLRPRRWSIKILRAPAVPRSHAAIPWAPNSRVTARTRKILHMLLRSINANPRALLTSVWRYSFASFAVNIVRRSRIARLFSSVIPVLSNSSLYARASVPRACSSSLVNVGAGPLRYFMSRSRRAMQERRRDVARG